MGLETVSPVLQGLQSPEKQARWAKSRRLLFEHPPNDNEPAYQARRDANVLGLPLVHQKASARACGHTAPSAAADATVRDLQRQAFEQSLLEGELLNERLRRQPGGPQAQAKIERKQPDLELQLLLDCPAYSSRDLPYTSSTHEHNEPDARLTALLQRSAQVERFRTAQRELVSASDAASQTLLRSEASDAAEACAIADLTQLRHSGSSFDAVALRRQDWLREKACAQEHKLQFRDAITGLASLKQRWAPELAPLFDAAPNTLSAVAVSNTTITDTAVTGTSMWVLGTLMVGEAAETVGTVLYFVQSDAPEPPQNGWRKFAAGLPDSTTTAVSTEAELTVTPLQPRPVTRCEASVSSDSSSTTTANAAVTAVQQQQQQLRGWTVAGAADPDLNGRYMLDTVRGTALDGASCYCSALSSSVLLFRHTVPAAQGLDTALAGCSLYDASTAEAAALRTAAGAAAQFSALAGSSMHAARMQLRTDTTTTAADAAAASEHSSAVTTQLDTVPVQHVQRLALLHSQNGAPLLCGAWATMGVCSSGQLCSGRHHFTSESERAAVTSARTAGAAVAEVAVLGCIAKREALLQAVTGAYFNVVHFSVVTVTHSNMSKHSSVLVYARTLQYMRARYYPHAVLQASCV
jgi:hypothetical protein